MYKRVWVRYRVDHGEQFRVYLPEWYGITGWGVNGLGFSVAPMTDPPLPPNYRMRSQVLHRNTDGYRREVWFGDKIAHAWPQVGGTLDLPDPDNYPHVSTWTRVAYKAEKIRQP